MDTIDVCDLSEEEAKLIATFVEFLRQRKRQMAQSEKGSQEVNREVLSNAA